MAIAFPGAMGYGGGTQGAREPGGTPDIYIVDSLSDNGSSGTLRHACEASGARIIIFNIGGNIVLDPGKGSIRVKRPYCTILGMTAPGDGITVSCDEDFDGPVMRIEESEVIVRYLRFRRGYHRQLSTSGDVFRIGDDGNKPKNIIIDHCTCTWGTDEVFDAYNDNYDVTISYCMIGQALIDSNHKEGPHGFGIILGSDGSQRGAHGVSLHHNFFFNYTERSPRFKTASTVPCEIIGNVYNNTMWRDSGWGTFHTRTENNVPEQNSNFVNNTVQIGPDRASKYGHFGSTSEKTSGDINIYEDGNAILEEDSGVDVTDENGYTIIKWKRSGDEVNSPHSMQHSYPVVSTSRAASRDQVLDSAGCSIPKRDKLDRDAIADARNFTGGWIDHPNELGGLPSLSSGVPWAGLSETTLPDYYVEEVGQHNPASLAPSGYTWAEEWSFTLSGDDSVEPPSGPPGNDDIRIEIISGNDDVHVWDGSTPGIDVTGSRVMSGHSSATEYNFRGVWRFPNVQVTNKSTAEKACNLHVYVSSLNGTAPTLRLYGLAEDDAAAINNESNLRTRLGNLTTAYVEWTPPSSVDNQWLAISDIGPILEEIWARDGWKTGNAMAFALVPESAAWGGVQERAKIVSDDSSPTLGAVLGLNEIKADDGGGGGGDEVEVTVRIDNGLLDWYTRENGEQYDNAGTRVYAGDRVDPNYDYKGYVCFPYLSIPQGSEILDAWIECEVGSTKRTYYDLRVYCQDVDSAIIATDYATSDSIPLTSNYVTWELRGVIVDNTFRTPPETNLKDIIQPVVNRPGWDPASILGFVLMDESDGASNVDRRIGFFSFEAKPATCFQIYIKYVEDPPPPPPEDDSRKTMRPGLRSGMKSSLA